ncbi:MAG: FemAB family PEP-CTERM system-associated protein [Gammaproteobacteria bacterium]|nr:FemAB family PEP-CTERM system-associated protein [Gammaproteobacteria bacterium]MCP5137614.1 FemAB family PEP-CTERM system-associated protein [Gammaproteobacteria bacterium]
MTDLEIKSLGDADRTRWDAFVVSCPDATFFHLSGWQRVIASALGHRTDYLYAERQGEIVGVLPLGHIRSRLFGDALTSVPFCVYGGIAANDPEAAAALQASAVEIAESRGVDHLELRHVTQRNPDWPHKDLYVTFRKAISADDEENMKAIPRKQRAMVRKGINAGLVSEIDSHVDRFYLAYSESVRNLGTPVLPKRWYAAIKAEFGEACELLTITHEGRLVAGVMSFYFRDEVLPYYGGGTDEARALKGNDFMYWEVMRRAAARGVRVFDYGRSKQGTGSFSFKKNWGFEPQPLYYEFHLVRAQALPDVNPLNPKYRMFIAAWQRLPLGLSRMLGPWLARNLG